MLGMEPWMALLAISLAVNGVFAWLWVSRSRRIEALESADSARAFESIRMAESLRQARARLESLMESPLVGIRVWSGKESEGSANRAFMAMAGMDAKAGGDAAQGGGDGGLFPCALDASLFGAHEREEMRTKGRCGPFETEVNRADGSKASLLAAAQLTDRVSGAGVCFAVDISRFRETSRELHRSEMRYRALAENSPLGIWQIRPDGRTIYINPAMSAILELDSPDDLMTSDQKYDEFFSPGSVEAILKEWRLRTLGLGSIYEVELVGRWGRRTRMILYGAPVLSQEGKLESLMGTFLDITERKREEEALRRSEERLRVAAECGNDLIYEWDIAGGSLEWFGPLEKRLGFGPGEAPRTREGWESLIHPEDREEVAAATENHLGGREPFFREYRIRGKDGAYRVWSDRGTALWNADGSPGKWIGTTSDVTDARRAESALRAKEVQLTRSQKLEAVGRLAGGIAHDFNNLLAAIMGYCELMLMRLEPDHICRKEVREILNGSDRAAGLIRQLLAFSRQEIPQPKVIHPNFVVESMQGMLRHVLEESIELDIRLGPDAGRVRMDPVQFEQVVMNLVLNARDAMPDGGVLLLTTATVNLTGEIPGAYGRVQPGPHMRLSVADSGQGIDRDHLPHIFDPFFTTKDKGKGTGLGLSTVYGIVTQNLGCVLVETEVAKGSVFSFFLPVTEEEAVEEMEVAKALRASSIMQRTVLVVDDDDDVRGIIRDLLGRQGYMVMEARLGSEALALAQKSAVPVHLLLTDVVMPGMGGRELADTLRKILPDMRVLFMSGNIENDEFRREVSDSGLAFIRKPFSMTTLAESIKSVLR